MICPMCNRPLEERKRKMIKDKDLRKPYFFARYFYCRPCKYMKSFEADKIFNHTSVFAREKSMRLLNFTNIERTPEENHLISISKE